MERVVDSGVPKAAEKAMETLKSYVVFAYQMNVTRNTSPSRTLEKEMKKLQDLSDKSIVKKILDHEAYRSKIQQIFHRVKEATMSFLVRTIIFI